MTPDSYNMAVLQAQMAVDPRFDLLDRSIISVIDSGVRSVRELAERYGMSLRNMQRRVRRLRETGLLTGRVRQKRLQPHPEPPPLDCKEYDRWYIEKLCDPARQLDRKIRQVPKQKYDRALHSFGKKYDRSSRELVTSSPHPADMLKDAMMQAWTEFDAQHHRARVFTKNNLSISSSLSKRGGVGERSKPVQEDQTAASQGSAVDPLASLTDQSPEEDFSNRNFYKQPKANRVDRVDRMPARKQNVPPQTPPTPPTAADFRTAGFTEDRGRFVYTANTPARNTVRYSSTPQVQGVPSVLTGEDIAQLDLSDASEALFDVVTAGQVSNLIECGLTNLQAVSALLCLTPDKVRDICCKAERPHVQDKRRYILKSLQNEPPEIDLYRMIPLIATNKVRFGIHAQKLVVQPKTEELRNARQVQGPPPPVRQAV